MGTDVRLSHTAATPPGFTVTVQVTLERVEGRKLAFSITAHDGMDTISEGTHERFVIDPVRFLRRSRRKQPPHGECHGIRVSRPASP